MKTLFALLALLSLNVIANAQGHGSARMFRFQGSDGGSMIQMTHRPDVAAEIGVKDEQKSKLDDLETRLQAAVSKAMANGSDDPDEMRTMIAGVGDKFAEELKSILTPRQYGRLREILFQKNGYGSLLRADAQSELNMDEAQKKGIAQAESDMLQKFDGLRGASLQPTEMRAAISSAVGDRDKAIENLLSPKQKAMFHHMQGKPFKFEEVK